MKEIKVGNTREIRLLKKVFKLLSNPLKVAFGPQMQCYIAGGAPADVAYKAITGQAVQIQDIDFFVTDFPGVKKALEADGFSEVTEKEYPAIGEKRITGYSGNAWYCLHPELDCLINIVLCQQPFYKKFQSFDISNRLAYYDGTGLFATDECLKALNERNVVLNGLDTAPRTAVRMDKFKNRYNWSIPKEDKYTIQVAVSKNIEVFKEKISKYCSVENIDDIVAAFFN